MRPHSALLRLTASTAIAALLLAPALITPALAQMGPAVVAASQQQTGDPPARVGRLARTTGTVSFHTADAEQWSPAQLNYPVTSGDAFWTEPDAQAELQVSASSISLSGGTEFVVGLLDENGLQATQGAGETYLHLRSVRPNEVWSVQTPRGLVTFSGDGRYAIVAGDTQTPTTITVLDGGARVTGPGLDLQVGPGRAAIVTGDETFQGSITAAQPDAFVTAMLARERPPQPALAPPAAVEMMPGGADLAAYGTWQHSPEYGAVWYPRVAPGWAPYRYGHWVWVWPWGWTWVDDDPWGFAPFHYGRWILIGSAWAWTPGVVVVTAPLVYAPALVTFFSISTGSIGWYPLGPHEPYHPWYRASDRYWREVNIHNVRNIRTIDRTHLIDRHINRSAATLVPVSVLQASRPVRSAAMRVDAREMTRARPVIGRDPVAPSRATFGVTAGTARRTRLAPVPPGAAARHGPAPGPAFRPAVSSGGARPQGRVQPVRPPVQVPGQQRQITPQLRPSGQPGHVGPSVVVPGGRPAVTAPELRPSPRPRQTGPAGAPTPRQPPLLQPGVRPAPVAPQFQGGATPRYQAPAAVPRERAPVSRPAPTYHAPAPAPQYRQPAQPSPRVNRPPTPTPQFRQPAQPAPRVNRPPTAPQYHPPAQPAQRTYRPPPAAAPHVQAPTRVAPAPQYRPPQSHAAPPRAAPERQPQHKQERQKRPGEP